MATYTRLTEVDKPNLNYEEKKPRLLRLRPDKKKRRWNAQIRRLPKTKGDEKTNPIINVSFQWGKFTQRYVEDFLWWSNEILYCQRNGYSLGESHNQAIRLMREKSPKQFSKIIDKLDIDLIRAHTIEKLFELYLEEVRKRTQLDRDPDQTRKGNAPPDRTTIQRIKQMRKILDFEMDPILLNRKRMCVLWENLATQKSKTTGNPYSWNTRKTLWAFMLTVYRRANREENKWIDINPLENTTAEDMPGYEKGKRKFEAEKNVVKKLELHEREWLISACEDDPTIKFLVAYMLHKPTRLSEAKDLRWEDFTWNSEDECWYVNCKVDRKSKAVKYQTVALPYRMNKEIREYRNWCSIKGQGANDRRIAWTVSDEHLAYNRAVRDKIKTRIRHWNAKHSDKQIPIYAAIMNTLRSNAFYYLLDLGIDLKSVADIGGTSVEQIQKAYCTDENANMRSANAKLLKALDRLDTGLEAE